MARPCSILVAVSFASLFAGGCRGAAVRVGQDVAPRPSTSGSAQGHALVAPALVIPAQVDGHFVVPSGSHTRAPHAIHVVAGGSLSIGAGATIAFDRGAGIFVDGGTLTAIGAASAPIVFTGAEPNAPPGAWSGIVFSREMADGSPTPTTTGELTHVVVEHAGASWRTDDLVHAAGVAIWGGPALQTSRDDGPWASITLNSVEFRNNASRGLLVTNGREVHVANLRFGRNGGHSALVNSPDLIEQLGVSPTESVELRGSLRRSVELPRLAAPWVIGEQLDIGGFEQTAVLTIATGNTVRLASRARVLVGGKLGRGKLVAHGVTFTSDMSTPMAGDWPTMTVLADLGELDLENDVFEYGGRDGRAVVSLTHPAASSRSHLQRVTFRNNAAVAIASPHCARWLAPALGNVSLGQPLCANAP